LGIKLLPLNVDFSSVSPDPKEAGVQSVKEKYPLKSGYFTAIGWSSIETFADRHRLAAYHNKHWQ